MQVSIGGSEVKGWSDAEVDEALGYLIDIQQTQFNIETSAVNSTHYLDSITTALFFMILISGISIGYSISHYFVIKSKDFVPR